MNKLERMCKVPCVATLMRRLASISVSRKASLYHTFTLSITLFTLCVIGAVAWFFYHQERAMLVRELQRHGLSLAQNLAYNSEYGLLFSDFEGLAKLVDGVVQDRDVSFALLADHDGVIMSEQGLRDVPALRSKIQERLVDISNLLQAGEDDRAPSIYFTERDENVYYIFAPVFMPLLEDDGMEDATSDGGDNSFQVITDEPRELLGLVTVGISFERVTDFLKEIQVQVMGLALFIVLLAVIVAKFLLNSVSRPLEHLAEGTERIARGDLSQEVKVTVSGEIGELAHSFNRMMHDLHSSRQELEHWAQTLERRVEERTSEIQEKNTKLTELVEQMKRMQEQLVHSEKMASLGQLVAGIAHEINNPVNFISSNIAPLKKYIQQLKHLIDRYEQIYHLSAEEKTTIARLKKSIDFDFLLEDLDDLIHDIETGAVRIKRIVQDLRNFSRVEEAEIKLINIHESLDSTLNLLGHLYEKRITVHKRYEAEPFVECYAGQLNQVFMNLLANAAQSLDERKGNVWLHTRVEDEVVVISIKDDGKGIPDEVLPKIFDPFFTTKDVGEGTGLGLSISYGIIEKHLGKITVTSQLEHGTEFTIRIPRSLSQELEKHEEIKREISL